MRIEITSCDIYFICVMHLLWDPDGSVWCRLEVKPTLKEGGLSATCSLLSLGWTMGCQSSDLGPLTSHYKYKNDDTEQLSLELDGKGGFD
jgi:hypothetical protein